MKHLETIYERYKEPKEHKTNSFGFKYGVRNYVDDVFDHLMNIICEVNGISEKSFKQLDETKAYLEKFFDNNQEILLDIDKMNDKRYQFTAEYIYDNFFKQKKELE
jgi:RNase adaptor protein for sRNA GlmZ degradation